MGSEITRPTYWAVLPAEIRYDEELPPNAKLLYAEISALTDRTGYCWATNSYFMQLYQITDRTVQRLLKALEKRGCIRIEDSAGGSEQRKIFAGINPLAPPDKNVGAPPTKMSEPPDKNVAQNNKYNKQKEQPPTAPQGARATEWEPEMFERFWKAYPCKKDKASARREWDKLKPDRKLMQTMSAALEAAKTSEEWLRGIGIPYAVRWLRNRRWEDELPEASPAATPREEEAAEWI